MESYRKELSTEHTVYTIDLLGCGRSAKPGITYTNFLYVQLICDFVKDVIKEKTDIIASGMSSSFAVMSCLNEKEYLGKLMLVNPPSLNSLQKMSGYKEKLLKTALEIPVFGTLVYHMIVSRENTSNLFIENMYHNPFHVSDEIIDTYYEAAHKGGCYAKFLLGSLIGKYVNISINHALSSIDNCIYIVSGEDSNSQLISNEYTRLNPAIESVQISKQNTCRIWKTRNTFLNKLAFSFSHKMQLSKYLSQPINTAFRHNSIYHTPYNEAQIPEIKRNLRFHISYYFICRFYSSASEASLLFSSPICS